VSFVCFFEFGGGGAEIVLVGKSRRRKDPVSRQASNKRASKRNKKEESRQGELHVCLLLFPSHSLATDIKKYYPDRNGLLPPLFFLNHNNSPLAGQHKAQAHKMPLSPNHLLPYAPRLSFASISTLSFCIHLARLSSME
jgi:hypothetical protein